MKALSIVKSICLAIVIVLGSVSYGYAQTAKQTKGAETAISTQKVSTGNDQVELKVFKDRYEISIFDNAGTQRKNIAGQSGTIGFMYSDGSSAEFDLVLKGSKLVYEKKDNLTVSKVRMKIIGGQEDIIVGFEIQ